MPRFVILEHDHPNLHWDFMLEIGAVLRTWRLVRAPEEGEEIDATAIGDHRSTYLDFEGPVSGGRGKVVRWDAGSFAEEPAGSAAGEIVIRLEGARLRGTVVLQQIRENDWVFKLKQRNPAS